MKLSGRSTSLGGLGLQRQRHLCVGADIADIPVVVSNDCLHSLVGRLRIACAILAERGTPFASEAAEQTRNFCFEST
jgi:hypothetical protein